MVGRLRDGVTLAEADAEARVSLSQARDGGADASLLAPQVFPFGDLFLPPGFSALLLVALIAAGRVLVVACANVANLLLVRTLARQTEMAVRAALGAGRGRIARQCVVESLLLAVPGTAVGLWLAALGVGYFGGFRSSVGLPYWAEFRLDPPVWMVAGGLTIVVAVAAGLVPAIRASQPSGTRLVATSNRGLTSAPRRASVALVVAQVAVSCALLVAAGLVTTSALNLRGLDRGFEAAPVLTGLVIVPQSHPGPAGTLLSLVERTRPYPGSRRRRWSGARQAPVPCSGGRSR